MKIQRQLLTLSTDIFIIRWGAISGFSVRLASLALAVSDSFLGSDLALEHFEGFLVLCDLLGLLLLLESAGLSEGSLLSSCCLDLLLLLNLAERVDEPGWQVVNVVSPELLALGGALFLGDLAGLQKDHWGPVQDSNALFLGGEDLSLEDLLSSCEGIGHLNLNVWVDDSLHGRASVVNVGLGQGGCRCVHLLDCGCLQVSLF